MDQRRLSLVLLVLAVSARVSTAGSFVCFDHHDAESCLAHKEGGLSACEWCAAEDTCHGVGSLINPCTDTCCASRSHFSECKHSAVDELPPVCEPFPRNTTAYSPELALRLVHLAGAAYCEPADLEAWSCTHCAEVPAFAPVLVALDDARQLQAIVGVDTSGPSPVRVVSFRGTVQKKIKDWVDDGEFWKVAPYQDLPDVRVHAGFYHGFTEVLKPQIVKALQDEQNFPDAPVHFTGHSLGGALAVVAAFDLAHSAQAKIGQVITYGQPRVGNRYFAQAYKNAVQNHWRVTHKNDVVPHIPLTDQAYDHSPREVYYPTDNQTGYVICNGRGEDRACSNRCTHDMACKSVGDHLLYLGVALGSQTCERLTLQTHWAEE